MECLELDIDYSKRAMINEKVLEINYPVDITSYEYQKNYYHHCYGLNEFEFIAQAMMTLGGGFDYDRNKGAFIRKQSEKPLPSGRGYSYIVL